MEPLFLFALGINFYLRAPNFFGPSDFVTQPVLPEECGGTVDGDHL
jgi:hypothetical protein